MDENTVRLLDLFSAYEPEEEIRRRLDQVKVFHAEIDMEKRGVSVTVQLQEYLPLRLVRKTERGIAGTYNIRRMELRTIYGPELLPAFHCSDVTEFLCEQFAPGMSILAGCSYTLTDRTLTISLKGNGKDMLRPYLGKAERWISDMFETDVSIQLESGSDAESEELFAATQRMRQQTMEQIPAPSISGDSAHRKASPSSELIFGKAMRGQVIPMREVSLDYERVTVEGEVFSVTSRDLKSGASVACFDVTDYTGSVRVNLFVEKEKTKNHPLLEKISKGTAGSPTAITTTISSSDLSRLRPAKSLSARIRPKKSA